MQGCQECGIQQFKLAQEEESKDVLVKWKRYEYINVQDKNGEERCKIALVVKETPVVEMFQYFLELLNDYTCTYHSFMAKWPKDLFDSLSNSLPKHHVLCVHDLSEKYMYTCCPQDEIQSQYFDPNKVSIHVTILYRHLAFLKSNYLRCREGKKMAPFRMLPVRQLFQPTTATWVELTKTIK